MWCGNHEYSLAAISVLPSTCTWILYFNLGLLDARSKVFTFLIKFLFVDIQERLLLKVSVNTRRLCAITSLRLWVVKLRLPGPVHTVLRRFTLWRSGSDKPLSPQHLWGIILRHMSTSITSESRRGLFEFKQIRNKNN